MKLWIARHRGKDQPAILTLTEPWCDLNGQWHSKGFGALTIPGKTSLPLLTFENSPQQVELNLSNFIKRNEVN